MLPMQGAWGSIPGQGTRFHLPELKIPHVPVKAEVPKDHN